MQSLHLGGSHCVHSSLLEKHKQEEQAECSTRTWSCFAWLDQPGQQDSFIVGRLLDPTHHFRAFESYVKRK